MLSLSAGGIAQLEDPSAGLLPITAIKGGGAACEPTPTSPFVNGQKVAGLANLVAADRTTPPRRPKPAPDSDT